MSKGAEEAALKAYPIQGKWVGNQYGEWDDDINQELRKAFLQGYEQAEKDTIERACLWLKTHLYRMESVEEIDLFNELFKNAMEEE